MFSQNQIQLPASLKDNQIAITFKKYLEALGPSSGFFSSLLYAKDDKLYFLLKDSSFPYIPIDWTLYTLMRTTAKTIITSGPTLRREKPIYGQSRGTFGKEELHKLYQDNTHKPFNLFVYTSTMKDQEIRQIISDKYFKFVSMKELGEVKDNFKEIAEKVNELQMGPTIYENGQASLGKAMREVKENEKNFVEMITLTVYQGDMPQKFIGDEYKTDIIYRDFEKIWQSETINSTAKHDDGQQKPITMKFFVYLRNDIVKKVKQNK